LSTEAGHELLSAETRGYSLLRGFLADEINAILFGRDGPLMRAAIYVRVSTGRQAERDLSLPDQVAQCRAYCERRGWEVVEVCSEPGASALDDDRPVFQEMIAKATRPEKPLRFVVVHSLSRFCRDTLHSEL